MADFGVNATSLSPAQGAGAQVIAPVQEQAVNDSFLQSPLLGGIVDIFSKGLINNRKEEAEKLKKGVVGGYVQQEVALNNAFSTGQITAEVRSARSRANFNKYAAGNPEFIGDIENAGKSLRGFTEAGQAEEALMTEKKQRDADISQAQTRGFIFTEGMNKPAQDDQIRAAKTSIRAEQELTDMYKRNAEARAQGTFDQGIADRDTKQLGIKLINEIAGDNLTAFQSLGNTLAADFRSGKLTPEAAQVRLAERFTNISAALTSAASTNPELAKPYAQLFNESNEVFKKLLDPKAVTEGLEDELKRVQARLKLVAYSDPKFASLVTVSNLLGNNPALALTTSTEAVNAITRISQTPGTTQTQLGGFTPQVVGNPDVEPGVLKMLKDGVRQLESPTVPKKDLLKVEVENSVNTVLRQTGEFLDKGATPEKLKGLAEFFASSDYGRLVREGKIDKQAQLAAAKTFQLAYEPAIINGVQQRFGEFLYGQAGQTKNPTTVGSAVNINFTGTGVVFEAKGGAGLDPVERQSQADAIRSLNSSQKAINQLINIGANMAGEPNLQKYWEENKATLVPGYFLKGMNVGDVRNGYEFLGGNASDKSNYRKVVSGGE